MQAAQNYLGNKEEAPNYIGIFGVDLALTPYAPFTRNASTLRQALAKARQPQLPRLRTAPSGSRRKASADQQAAGAAQTAATAAASRRPGR